MNDLHSLSPTCQYSNELKIEQRRRNSRFDHPNTKRCDCCLQILTFSNSIKLGRCGICRKGCQ